MAAVGVVLTEGQAGGGVASLDDLGPTVAVEVGQRRRGEVAVGLEPGKPGELGSVGRVEGVLLLPQRAGRHVEPALQVAHGEGGLNAVVRGGIGAGIGLLHEPGVAAVRADGLIAAARGHRGVTRPHEDGVQRAPGRDGGHRGTRVHRRAGLIGPYPGPGGQVEAEDVAGLVAHHDGGTAGEVGHVGRGQGDRVRPVGQHPGLPRRCAEGDGVGIRRAGLRRRGRQLRRQADE